MTFDRKGNEAKPKDVAGIEAGLRKIRTRRRWAHMPLKIFLVLVFWSMSASVSGLPFFPAVLWVPRLWQAMTAVAFGCAMFIGVVTLPCPRCGNWYHFGPRYRNDLARRCLWCGLRLDGSNTTEPFEVKSSV